MNSSHASSCWLDAEGLRIWRSGKSAFNEDEPLQAPAVYTDEELQAIAAAGFNAIWLRGRLRDLAVNSKFAELDSPASGERRSNLQVLIERAARCGLKVFLYFNEPLAVASEHAFWRDHQHLAGQPHRDFDVDFDVTSLCTSTPKVQAYLEDTIESVLRDLPGLGGVILITASEYHTHCWSHHAKFSLNDGVPTSQAKQLQCPRCAEREPAAVVAELIDLWRRAAQRVSPAMRVLCWNWSWSMWYPEPQREVIDALPAGVELLVDFERGTQVQRLGRTLAIDEYSLSVVGPSERFLGSHRAAKQRGMPVHAKVQLGTTHEIATVPNLPLLARIHAKLAAMTELDLAGFMGCWNFGCSLTLNTAAVELFRRNPQRFRETDTFLEALARWYFELRDDAAVRQTIEAWRAFGDAFDCYPFANRFIYFSVVNEAPAYPLTLRYEARPMVGSWIEHASQGDRLEDALPDGMTLDEVADALEQTATRWQAGVVVYEQALVEANTSGGAELSCARMIGLQLASAARAYRWHSHRLACIGRLGLKPPCEAPMDATFERLLREELVDARAAAELCRQDARLGFHQEAQAVFYDEARIREKIRRLEATLAGSGG